MSTKGEVWIFVTDSNTENNVTVHDSWESAEVLARDFVKDHWPSSLGEIPEDVEEALRVLGEKTDQYGKIEAHVPLTVEESKRIATGGAGA